MQPYLRYLVADDRKAQPLALYTAKQHFLLMHFHITAALWQQEKLLRYSPVSSGFAHSFVLLTPESSQDNPVCLTQLMIVLWLMPVSRSISRNPKPF